MREEMQSVHRQGPVMAGLLHPALVSAGLFMAITGLAYPLVTTAAAWLLFPHQAEGSIVTRNGAAVGSEIIGQSFTKPYYFHPRPSATTGTDPKDPSKTVDQPYNAANSGASNLAPTSKKLIGEVADRVAAYRKENSLGPNEPVPVDAVTTSASGLDPDISLANAQLQAKRVATARGIPPAKLLGLLASYTRGPQYGLIGYPRVNVLELNLALDNLAPRTSGK